MTGLALCGPAIPPDLHRVFEGVAEHARKTLVASRRAVIVCLNELAPCSDGRCEAICPASGPDQAKPLVVRVAQMQASKSANTTVACLQACCHTRYCTCIMSDQSARPTPRASKTPPETSYLSTTSQAIISYQITKDDIVVRPNRQQQFRHTCVMSIPAPEISHA